MCWYLLKSTPAPRLVERRHAELQIIKTTGGLRLQSKVREGDEDGLVVRKMQVKHTFVVIGIDAVYSVEERRCNVTDCVRQPYDRQVLRHTTTLNEKMERYGRREAKVVTPEAEEEGGGGVEGHTFVSQH